MEFEICAWYRVMIAGEQEKEFDMHYPVANSLAEAAKIVAKEYGRTKQLFQLLYNNVEIDKNLYLESL